jgi:hypothetical protein
VRAWTMPPPRAGSFSEYRLFPKPGKHGTPGALPSSSHHAFCIAVDPVFAGGNGSPQRLKAQSRCWARGTSEDVPRYNRFIHSADDSRRESSCLGQNDRVAGMAKITPFRAGDNPRKKRTTHTRP